MTITSGTKALALFLAALLVPSASAVAIDGCKLKVAPVSRRRAPRATPRTARCFYATPRSAPAAR